MFSTLCPTWLVLLLASFVLVRAADSNPDDPTGKTLYVTEPACGFYKCVVTWRKGERVAVNWLGPPPGNVSVQLVSNTNGPTYTIVSSYPSISQEGYCDGGYGLGVVTRGVECGRVEFLVPAGWTEMNNYTIAVTSLKDSSLVGYTDSITIAAANSSTSGDAPAGTVASLLTIPNPTSTNVAGSTVFSGDIPSPTAITGLVTTVTATTSRAIPSASVVASSGTSSRSTAPATATSGTSPSGLSSSAVASPTALNSAGRGSFALCDPLTLGLIASTFAFVAVLQSAL